MHLHEFITANRNDLIASTRARVAHRPWPFGLARRDGERNPAVLDPTRGNAPPGDTGGSISATAIGSSATKHGRDLLGQGFTVSQVVHDYGDACQAITELAIEQKATISAEEFQILNHCLDTAIAEAVTEYGRLQTEAATESGRLHTESVPRWTGEIRPTADGSKPANGRDPRPVRFYPAASSFCNA